MHDCDNNNCSSLYLIINAKRKTAKQSAPRISVNNRMQLWCFRNRREDRERLAKKLAPQSPLLLFIPERRIRQIYLHFRTKANFKRHILRRMSATATAAKRPIFSSIS